MMNEHRLSGTTIFIFFTSSELLFETLDRDMHALGWGSAPMRMPETAGKDLPSTEGVVFCTYSMLAHDKGKRVEQLVRWASGKKAMLVFDEIHRACGGEKGKLTQTGMAVLKLQGSLRTHGHVAKWCDLARRQAKQIILWIESLAHARCHRLRGCLEREMKNTCIMACMEKAIANPSLNKISHYG